MIVLSDISTELAKAQQLISIPYLLEVDSVGEYYQFSTCHLGGVAEWLRRSVSNHARSTRVGSNPVVEPLTTSQQSTHLSILPRSVNEYSEVTLRAQALGTY